MNSFKYLTQLVDIEINYQFNCHTFLSDIGQRRGKISMSTSTCGYVYVEQNEKFARIDVHVLRKTPLRVRPYKSTSILRGPKYTLNFLHYAYKAATYIDVELNRAGKFSRKPLSDLYDKDKQTCT